MDLTEILHMDRAYSQCTVSHILVLISPLVSKCQIKEGERSEFGLSESPLTSLVCKIVNHGVSYKMDLRYVQQELSKKI